MLWNDYVVGTLLTFVIICGLIGNSLVIYSIMKERRLLKSNYYYLVLILAVFDAIHLSTALRVNYADWFQTWPLPHTTACKIWLHFEMLVCTFGVELMVIICILRYRAVLQPLKRPIHRKTLRLIVLILFLAINIYLVPHIIAYKYSQLKGCHQHWSNKTLRLIYTLLSLLIHYVLPVIVMSILYFRICTALVKQSRKMNSMLQDKTTSNGEETSAGTSEHFQRIRHHRNTRTFLISVVSVGIFSVALLPFEIWWICNVNDFGALGGDYAGWFYLSYMIGSSSVNPFIYGVLDRKLVEALKRNIKSEPKSKDSDAWETSKL